MFKELFDFSYVLPSARHRQILFLFMFTILLYSLNIMSEDIPLSIVLLLCAVSPIELGFLLFTFYSLFEGVAIFSFGLTLNVVLQLVLFIKVIAFILKHPVILNKSTAGLKIGFSVYFLLYAIIAILSLGNVTGMAFFFRIVISIMVVWYVQVRKIQHNYWKAIFHIITLSVFCSVLYGFFNDTSLEREIVGLESSSVFQLYGSLGTTRLGMFLVIALIYPLYFVHNKILKIGLILALTTLTFMTVSLTAIIVLVMLYGLYVMSLNKFRNIVKYSLISLVLLVGTFNFWSKISFVEPIVLRATTSIDLATTGSLDRATSGREHIQQGYMEKYHRRTAFNKFVGEFNPDNFDESIGLFAHNSYIDVLAYNGILGIILLLVYCIKSIFYYRKTEEFYPVLSMKLVLLVAAYTVSIYTSSYFTWYIFM